MFCNKCGASNPIESSFCSSCGTKMANGQSAAGSDTGSYSRDDFDNQNNLAWDFVESEDYVEAENIFRKLCDAGFDDAWLGLGFVLRDTPMERSSTEYSQVAVKALASLSSESDESELAVVIGSVVLPLARYTIHAKLVEWTSQEGANKTSWSELVSETSQWIDWVLSLTEMVKPFFEPGAIALDVSIYYYETVYRIGELVNDAGHLRDVLEGEEANSYLTSLGRMGFSKFGRWT